MNVWLLLIAVGLVLGVLLIYVTTSWLNKGQYQNMIDELVILKYEISNKPIVLELEKLRKSRKNNQNDLLVSDWEESWGILTDQLQIVDDNISYAEETLRSKEIDHAKEIINITKKDLAGIDKISDSLMSEIKNSDLYA
ncbi:MAG: hypothetical protein FWE07_05100 [Turicibacter sp.]|nr:hypothetical protein [Turicibacter sp.]